MELFLGTERVKFKLVSLEAVFVLSRNAPSQQFYNYIYIKFKVLQRGVPSLPMNVSS